MLGALQVLTTKVWLQKYGIQLIVVAYLREKDRGYNKTYNVEVSLASFINVTLGVLGVHNTFFESFVLPFPIP